jgi:hypothetical protein
MKKTAAITKNSRLLIAHLPGVKSMPMDLDPLDLTNATFLKGRSPRYL